MGNDELEFDKKVVDLDAISQLTPDHQLPRDREMEAIRSRRVFHSQFGIRQILGLVVIVAFVCALPGLVGWDQERYAVTLLTLSLFFAPLIGFIIASVANIYGFNRRQRTIIGWIGGCLAAIVPLTPAFLVTTIPIRELALPILFWIPQLALTAFCKWLFSIEPRVKRYHEPPQSKVD